MSDGEEKEDYGGVMRAIGQLEGTLNGVATDIGTIKSDVGKQYSLLQKQNGRIHKLETVNELEEKHAAAPAPAPVLPAEDSPAEEAIAMRYIRRHRHGAIVGGIGVGGAGGGVILLLWALKYIFTGDPTPPVLP